MTENANTPAISDRLKDVATFDPALGAYNFGDLGQAVEFAQLMCKAGPLIPKFMQREPAICLGIVMRAKHWGMDPFGLAQSAYQSKEGAPVGYEAKVFTSALQNCTGITLKFRFVGEIKFTGQPRKSRKGNVISANEARGDRRCIAYAVIDGEEITYETLPLENISPKNSSQWDNDPDQQLAYYAGRGWVRRHRGGVMLGAYSNEEVEDMESMRDVTPRTEQAASSFAARKAALQPAVEDAATTHEDASTAEDETSSDLPVQSTPKDTEEGGGEAGRGDPAPTDTDDVKPSEEFLEGVGDKLSGHPRTACPPDYSEAQKADWYAGYDSEKDPIEETKQEDDEQ